MAKVHNNIFVRGLTGALGDQFVIRRTRSGRTIIANKPVFDENRVFSPAQKAQQEAFRKAIAYAKAAKRQLIYAEMAKGTDATPYNKAMADWFGQPQVLEIDPSGWHGQKGQIIRVRAQDDTCVASVQVIIQGAEGKLVEQGQAVQSDGLWWSYTTTTSAFQTPYTRVTAVATDLPGNSHTLVWKFR